LPNSLPKDAFKKVVELYVEFLDRDALIRNYIDFCENYLELEKTVTLPEYIHTETPNQGSDETEDFFDDFEQNESNDENEASISDRTNIENSGSMNKLFQLFCILELRSVFPVYIHYYKLLLHYRYLAAVSSDHSLS